MRDLALAPNQCLLNLEVIMRLRLLRVTVLLLILSPSGLAAAYRKVPETKSGQLQNNTNAQARDGSQANANTGSPATDAEKTTLDLAKLKAELDKLKAEADGLRISNEALGAWTKFLTAWLAAIGSIIAGLLIWLLGRSLNKTQKEKLEQEMEIEAGRFKQGHEKHNLEVFQALGNEEPRVRVGAVAVLVQRIAALQAKQTSTPAEKEERDMLVSVLVSGTKYEDEVEVQKYIADGLADSLQAIVPSGQKPTSAVSPLKSYDFQGAKLGNAWWKRIDARGVDFYKAHLARAGLREAFLSDAVLKDADLTDATLVKAQLDGANLQGAQLTEARLKGANLKGANLKEANLDRADLSDAELDAADLSNATFNGTILKGAHLGAAKFDGADLSRAIL
jgi:hypothetical protein